MANDSELYIPTILLPKTTSTIWKKINSYGKEDTKNTFFPLMAAEAYKKEELLCSSSTLVFKAKQAAHYKG